jgi:hypothetical protein
MAGNSRNCCNLVGNFPSTAEGLISVSSRGNTGFQYYSSGGSSNVAIEPSTGTVSISAYASSKVHEGCAGRATVSINWQRRTDCDVFIYLFAGAGKSTITGNVQGLASFPSLGGVTNPIAKYNTVDASASSGPAALYTDDIQYDGIGLIYTGNPWYINTMSEDSCKINLTSYGIGGYGLCFLQSINLQCVPGKIPIVSLDFIYTINN